MSYASVAGTRSRRVRKEFRRSLASDNFCFVVSFVFTLSFLLFRFYSFVFTLSFYARLLCSRDYQSRFGVLRGVIPEVVDKFIGCVDFTK